ncbi:UNVERIFIED_CONTAM: stage IV sporulation protein FA [Brevibacillus sp. OAP136]
MFNEVDRVKERRRERIEKIRMQQPRDGMPPHFHELNDPIEESFRPSLYPVSNRVEEEKDETLRMPPQDRLGLQTFGSLLLIGVAYLVFQSNVVLPTGWKDTAKEVMTRDYNFETVANWYQGAFGKLPSVLPAFAGKDAAVPAQTNVQTQKWTAPATWKVVQPFTNANGRVVVNVGADGKVLNAEQGWVTFIGEKPGLGFSVVVQYANQREVWFSNLEQAAVALNDWVYPGSTIGIVRANGNQERQAVLVAKEGEKFINPLDVIPIE